MDKGTGNDFPNIKTLLPLQCNKMGKEEAEYPRYIADQTPNFSPIPQAQNSCVDLAVTQKGHSFLVYRIKIKKTERLSLKDN